MENRFKKETLQSGSLIAKIGKNYFGKLIDTLESWGL